MRSLVAGRSAYAYIDEHIYRDCTLMNRCLCYRSFYVCDVTILNQVCVSQESLIKRVCATSSKNDLQFAKTSLQFLTQFHKFGFAEEIIQIKWRELPRSYLSISVPNGFSLSPSLAHFYLRGPTCIERCGGGHKTLDEPKLSA